MYEYMYEKKTRTTRKLDLDTVVDAALELFETEGLGGVTLRAVAKRCGVGTMTLYTYVATKEDLLAAISDRLIGEIELPEPGTMSWQEEVAAVFRSAHNVFMAHPNLARVALSQPIDGPNSYRGAEYALSALRRGGLPDEAAVAAFDALSSYTAGFTGRYAGRMAVYVPPAERLQRVRRLPAAEFPTVLELAEPLVERDSKRDFEYGLMALISGIEASA
jgi:AcrR family transcriptional regulator